MEIDGHNTIKTINWLEAFDKGRKEAIDKQPFYNPYVFIDAEKSSGYYHGYNSITKKYQSNRPFYISER